MFGYLRPRLKYADSKIKEQYRAVYCGLCHCLKKHYGIRGVACLNYEVTFLLLMIVSVNEGGRKIFHGSCSMTPFVRVPFINYLNNDTKTAADISIIASSFEIKDNLSDGGFFIWRVFDYLLNSLSVKATEELSEFERTIQSKLSIFNNIEKADDYNFDERLKSCGDIVESITYPLLSFVDGPIAEGISIIANYIGQWIYLLDACDDFQNDLKKNNHNPLKYVNNYQEIQTKINELQEFITKQMSMLPANEYRGLLQYFTGVCMPQTSAEILEKYMRGLTQ